MKLKIPSVAAITLMFPLLAGCAISGRAYQPEPVPKAPLAAIYLYRPYHFYGSAIAPAVACAGQAVPLKPGGYTAIYARPGPQICTASTEAVSELKFNVEPGRNYFIREEIVPGNIIGRAHFALADSDTAHKQIAKCHEQTIPDPDLNR
ncbi:MAG: hypothetical protein ACREP6_15675 [Candidatus Binataceae bacterium]